MDASDWDIGNTLRQIASDYFDYRKATQPPAVQWVPGGTNGTQYGVGAGGELYTRGVPGATSVSTVSVVNQLMPLALVAGLGFLVYRMAR